MKPVLSREQMRAFDQHAMSVGVSGVVLMENAGRGATEVIANALPSRSRVAVVTGSGNNGGDGYVVARRLRTLGHDAEVWSVVAADQLKGDALTSARAWTGVGGTVHLVSSEAALASLEAALCTSHTVVDALFGTGLTREITGLFADVIEKINGSGARVAALDIPSGLDANRGAILGTAVRADLTITFAHLKLGLLTTNGAEFAGRLHLADIGVPSRLPADGGKAGLLERSDVARLIRPRLASSHKGRAGRVLVVAGSPGKVGAALLVAHGALRAGAGLVTVAAEEPAARVFDQRVLEAMTAVVDPNDLDASLGPLLERADCVALGPGMGLGESARAVVDRVALEHAGSVILDADALTHFGGRAEILAGAKGPRILTPHPAELARLLGTTAQEVELDRFAAVDAAVHRTGANVLLKGPRTAVGAPGRSSVVVASGVPALATGGAGDVLAGVVAALCAGGLAPREAAYCGAYLHGLAARMWQEDSGADRGLLAHEVADRLPAAFAALASPTRLLTD